MAKKKVKQAKRETTPPTPDDANTNSPLEGTIEIALEGTKAFQIDVKKRAKEKIQARFDTFCARYNAAPRPEKIMSEELTEIKKFYTAFTDPQKTNYTFEELMYNQRAYLSGWRDYEIGETKTVTLVEEKTIPSPAGEGYVESNWQDNRVSDSYVLGYGDAMLYHFIEKFTGDADSEPLSNEKNKTKTTVRSYALIHIFWRKYDRTKAITNTNKASWAKKYGISQNTLKQDFDKYFEKSDRKPVSKDKRAVVPFINCFSRAVEILKMVCKNACEDAENELISLKKHYETKTD